VRERKTVKSGRHRVGSRTGKNNIEMITLAPFYIRHGLDLIAWRAKGDPDFTKKAEGKINWARCDFIKSHRAHIAQIGNRQFG
jgi:hypothetical protein